MAQTNKIKIRRGLNSALPSGGTEAGEPRYSTDTKELWIDDGTNNVKVGSDQTLLAPLASPALTGTPTVPTASAGTNTTQAASTAFVTTADNLKAPLASPTFTGTPAAPTASPGTNTTQVATTAYVTAADALKPDLTSSAASTSAVADTATAGVATTAARADHKHAREAFGAVTAQTTYGASSANGSATTLARSDHTHGTPAATVDATTGVKGVVQLAGDLAGTATAPVVATGAITSAKILDGTIVDGDINASAAIAATKISGTAVVTADTRLTDARTPADDPIQVTSMWTILSARPYAMGVTTGAFAKDNWRLVPCRLAAALPIKALTVETTVAASGGTADLIFAIYSVGSDGRPDALLTDLSGAGTIDLTATAGVQTRTGISASIPAGNCFIGAAWSGTATVGPTVRTLASTHPRIIDAAAGVVNRNGYVAAVSGATAPSTVTVSTNATTGLVIFGQIV